ncbi:hypothetical protein H1S01_09835 [Heliobacterium chlorum]|uniref:Uncharacterized protein n=1 Tax=Heliobacterium chlorum TaxID=2698 RepID=A0ABR7T576_HELCL|nr:hypothetical protein [Heliobacterium chlorum]MBC9784811.1 hypothetical protein [Heliobacterium chlorum]
MAAIKVNILLPLLNMAFFFAWGHVIWWKGKLEWIAGSAEAKDRAGLARWVGLHFLTMSAASLIIAVAGLWIPDRYGMAYFFGYLLVIGLWLHWVGSGTRKF